MLLAFFVSMTLLAVLFITGHLDRRLKNGSDSKISQLLIRLPLLVAGVAAVTIVPGTVWREAPDLYSNLGVASFVISLLLFCAGVVIYALRMDRRSNH